jgi:hypothetical protein
VNVNQIAEAPRLGKPGAGLPTIEWFVARYILLPKLFKTTGKKEAIENFAKLSEKIVLLSSNLSPEQFTARRLIPRIRGLEDSSRYWSVAMTLEHLVIVGNLMGEAAVQLSSGHPNLRTVGTADVKPDPNADPATAIQSFKDMSERFVREAQGADVDAFPKLTHPHPWFGPLNAQQWLAMAGAHQNIHRQQIKEIIARLDE